MSRFSYRFDSSYNPNNEKVYQFFVEYFENPILSKIRDNGNFSIYMIKTPCLLINKYRYICVTVPIDPYKIGHRFRLNELVWSSFQTRMFNVNHSIDNHFYTQKNRPPYNEMVIKKISENEYKTVYNCEDLDIEVELIHKEQGLGGFAMTGNIVNALETYSTVVLLND